MPIAQLHKFLTKTVDRQSRSHTIFWLTLSLTFAAVYGFLGLRQAFSAEYIVQDDARQLVFWMMRFVDRELFPNDFIANYFQSAAPAGYSILYKIAATIGIPPLFFNKILPFFRCVQAVNSSVLSQPKVFVQTSSPIEFTLQTQPSC